MLDPLGVLREHQGAARLLDRALRRARPDDRPGRAHPRASRRDARRRRAPCACDPAPDEVFILNDPFAGGTHLPDITLVSRTRARLRGHARAPRGRRRRRSRGACPRSRAARRGGRRDPADAARRRGARRARRPHAQPRRAPRRPPRAARRSPARRAPARRALRTARPRAGRARDGRALRLLGAPASAPRSRALPDGRFEATDVARGRTGASSSSARR